MAKLYGPLIYRWARRVGLRDDDAADIGQEVFRTVAGRIDSFQHGHEGNTFRGWLWQITRNKLGDFFRRHKDRAHAAGGTDAQIQMQQAVDVLSEESYDLISAGFDVERSLVQRAVTIIQTEFEANTWRAFWRSAVEGHRTDIIADDLGMTNKAVRQAKYRVLRRLRVELADE